MNRISSPHLPKCVLNAATFHHSEITYINIPATKRTGPSGVVSLRVRSAQNFARVWWLNIVKLFNQL